MAANPVTDPKDVRVMIPRVRRALTGPTGSGFVQTEMNDTDTAAVIADAIADVILYAGSAFGKTLNVTDRDSYFMAPIAWATSDTLTDAEQAVISAQAALTYLTRSLSEMKTGQTIHRGDEEWTYSISASALAARIKALQDARDRAIEQLEIGTGAVEVWVNTLSIRDQFTDMLIEPYVSAGIGGQLEIANPDFRFGDIEWLQA